MSLKYYMKNILSTIILIVTLTAVTISMTGCFDEDVDEYYVAVSPGITLFDNASTTNEISLDGVSVAMRLSLLLTEIARYEAESGESFEIGTESQSEPDWDLLGTIEFGSYTYYRKNLLFGDDEMVRIWRSSDSKIYYIKFGKTVSGVEYHTQADFDDTYYRRGTYAIQTNGVEQLEQATSTTAWSITADGDTMEFSTKYDAYPEYRCDYSNASVSIYYDDIEDNDDDKGFIYDISNIAPNYASSSSQTNWSMKGYINLVDFMEASESFCLDDTINKRYELNIYALGTPIDAPSMTYYTIDPIEYRPATTGFSRYNAEIVIVLDTVTEQYEATDVFIELRNDGYMNVEYNGVTYYDDEDDDDD